MLLFKEANLFFFAIRKQKQMHNNSIFSAYIFTCLGRQTKQIMVAKFQTQMLLIASAESSPLF
jgi:phage antirepressor YoqD-like protein